MSTEDELSQSTINLSQKRDNKRKRGLSKRLNVPLSLESNTQDPNAEVEEKSTASDAEADNESVTRVVKFPEASKPTSKEEDIKTRNVSPSSVAGGADSDVSEEGLLSTGTKLQDRYEILGVVGIGGMGAVYRARDLRFPGVNRICAVKEMINTASDPQVRQMIVRNFEREASILATLSHPAIPQVYDFFTEGARSYLVIEFVPGEDLEVKIAEAEGYFPEPRVIEWAVQLCDVLSYLHNHKPRPIIFRDLKPSNIMLDDQDRIRLVDFGIAKLFQSGEKGTTIGTEGYSPPEQYRGIAEPRGDLYALGATLHHILSKQDPRLEPPFSFAERPIHKTNPTVSKELVDVIEKALEYDINKRWASTEELRRALLSVSSARGVGRAGSQGETQAFGGTGILKAIWQFACEDEVRGAVQLHDEMLLVPSYDHNVYALDIENGDFIWKYPTEGGIASSPCVQDGMAVFGSTDQVVYSVDLQTGRLLWTMPTEGRVYSSAYSELGHFFIGSDDRNLYAIHQHSGRKAWSYTSDGKIRSQPFVDDNLLLFSCEMGMVYALGLDRKMRWRFRSRRGILAAPILSEGLVFIGSLDWSFYALDVRSGWSAWKYRTGGGIASTAAVWEDLVFFGSADRNVYALDKSEGRVVWRYETEGQVTSTPTVYEGAVYVGGVDGALYCLDARNGSLRWRYQTDGPITGQPKIADGVVYFGSSDRNVYAVPA
jgi:outer membrane protein assembly factor BamB